MKRSYVITTSNVGFTEAGTDFSDGVLPLDSNIFSQFLDINTEMGYNRVTVTQVAIPVSYYLVQKTLNTFTLKEDSTSVPLSITPGNYSILSFSLYISALLTANSPNGLTYTVTFNSSISQPEDGLLYYSVNSAAHNISFIFSANNSVAEQFGFFIGSTSPLFVKGSSTATLTSTCVCQFTPENVIIIYSNLVDATESANQVLQECYNQNTIPYGYIAWQNPAPLTTSKKLVQKTRNANFTFTSEEGFPIYFNGITVSFTICIYKDNDIYEKIYKYISYRVKKEHMLNEANAPDEEPQASIQDIIESEENNHFKPTQFNESQT